MGAPALGNQVEELVINQEPVLQDVLNEERKKMKGKALVEEELPTTSSPLMQPRADGTSTKATCDQGIQATNEALHIPVDSLPHMTWVDSIPNDHILMEWRNWIKVFEDVLEKQDCELHNHEAWRPTFTANVIQILVRDLVCKVKDPNRGVIEETKEACTQAYAIEQNIQFIEDLFNVWLQQIIPKLTTWIIKCDRDRNELLDAKLHATEATNKAIDTPKKLKELREKFQKPLEDLQATNEQLDSAKRTLTLFNQLVRRRQVLKSFAKERGHSRLVVSKILSGILTSSDNRSQMVAATDGCNTVKISHFNNQGKTELAHKHPFTLALKNLGRKPDTVDFGTNVRIERDGKVLSVAQLEREYQEWITAMHESYDEEVECCDEQSVLIVNPCNKRDLGISQDGKVYS
eukprot:Gb_24290 [translate_table: standard]